MLSDRDADAPTLDEARAASLLPTWDDTRAFVEDCAIPIRRDCTQTWLASCALSAFSMPLANPYHLLGYPSIRDFLPRDKLMTTQISHFIDGKRTAGQSTRTADVMNPNTGQVQAKVPMASAADVDAAVVSARPRHRKNGRPGTRSAGPG